VTKRFRTVLRLSDAPAMADAPPPWVVRPVRDDDREALAVLMVEAYRGTVDDEGETLEAAREEVRRTFDGDYGPFLPQFSVVAERTDRLAGASLITMRKERPSSRSP
jgi:hypothetical protein